MGLFHILKNGLTIEKKKVQPETEPDNATEILDETTNDIENVNQTVISPEPSTLPTPQPTIEEQRLEAASVLLGDNGLTHGATPSLIQVAPTASQATQATSPQATTETTTQQQFFNTHNNIASNFDHTLLGTNQNLLVITPQSPAEISTILTNLANGNNCIVSLTKFTLQEAQRFLDYICGFVNAIGGTIMQRSAMEFILAPKGVSIKNS